MSSNTYERVQAISLSSMSSQVCVPCRCTQATPSRNGCTSAYRRRSPAAVRVGVTPALQRSSNVGAGGLRICRISSRLRGYGPQPFSATRRNTRVERQLGARDQLRVLVLAQLQGLFEVVARLDVAALVVGGLAGVLVHRGPQPVGQLGGVGLA